MKNILITGATGQMGSVVIKTLVQKIQPNQINVFTRNKEKLVKFQSENKMTLPYYDLVKTWFGNNNQSEINSVPRSFIAELAVHPSFTRLQQRINDFDDENSKFTKIATDFSNREL